MAIEIPLGEDARAEDLRTELGVKQVAADLAYLRLMMVNLVFVGHPGSVEWVLVDTGIVGSAAMIPAAADERFGKSARPTAIVMTHGHFDHVGALEELGRYWDVPI